MISEFVIIVFIYVAPFQATFKFVVYLYLMWSPVRWGFRCINTVRALANLFQASPGLQVQIYAQYLRVKRIKMSISKSGNH